MPSDELTSRSRTYAEAVVTMVWLVLVAAAFKGKSEVTGIVLGLACLTIITGIGPLLACCISNSQGVISDVTALISAATLSSLAYWIAAFTCSEEFMCILIGIAAAALWCTGFRVISYCKEKKKHGHPARTKEFHTVLDGSHEFLCCMTGIHFLWLGSLALHGLWLESLALDGLIISKSHGIQHVLSEATGICNIIFCSFGLFKMHIGMTPPIPWSEMAHIPGPFIGPDSFMIFSIGIVLIIAMWKLLVLQGLVLLIVGPLIAVFVRMRYASCSKEAGGSPNREPPKLAPLGLTKLMVTGFLTVSCRVGSTNQSIKWFLVSAAAAIISGLIWRLLTQAQVWKTLENNKMTHVSRERIDKLALVAFSAKTACFCAHTFAAIATALLMLKIYI